MTEQQTPDREKKIAEIREALEKATQGPWKVKKGERWAEDYPRETYIQAVWDKPDHRGCVGYRVAKMSGVHDKTMRDAYLIANAPEWLRFLLDELERLEREYTEERAAHNAHVTELCELEKENRKLRQEREKLIGGLWYLMKELGKLSDKNHGGFGSAWNEFVENWSKFQKDWEGYFSQGRAKGERG